jgi:REP element-mobilizing transposase RayT
MGRILRIQFPGAHYHVTMRGNAKQRVFLDDWDFTWLLGQLEVTVTRHEWICFAYSLLGNHFHLCVATPKANLAEGMRLLNDTYAQRFNRRYDRSDVFQGPYRSRLIKDDRQLLATSRYIALNPVRAGLCSRPELWAVVELPRDDRGRKSAAVACGRCASRHLRDRPAGGRSRVPPTRRERAKRLSAYGRGKSRDLVVGHVRAPGGRTGP